MSTIVYGMGAKWRVQDDGAVEWEVEDKDRYIDFITNRAMALLGGKVTLDAGVYRMGGTIDLSEV